MKKNSKLSRVFVLVLFLLPLTFSSMAQKADTKTSNPPCLNQKDQCPGPPIPNLSEEQMNGIKASRLELMKKNQPIENEIGELQARLKTLQSAPKADMNAINKVIDQISDKKAQLAKNMAAHEQEVRKLLNDEQRLFFDQHRKNGPQGPGPNMNNNCKGPDCKGNGKCGMHGQKGHKGHKGHHGKY